MLAWFCWNPGELNTEASSSVSDADADFCCGCGVLDVLGLRLDLCLTEGGGGDTGNIRQHHKMLIAE